MDVFNQVIGFFAQPAVQSFLISYVSTSLLDGLTSKVKSSVTESSFEKQFTDALIDTWGTVCKSRGWKDDPKKLTGAFLRQWQQNPSLSLEAAIRLILEATLKQSVDDVMLQQWIQNFYIAVSDPKRAWLHGYICTNNSLQMSSDISKLQAANNEILEILTRKETQQYREGDALSIYYANYEESPDNLEEIALETQHRREEAIQRHRKTHTEQRRWFKITDFNNVKTIAFRLIRLLNPKTNKLFPYFEAVVCQAVSLDDQRVKCTVDFGMISTNEEIEFTLIQFDHNTDSVYMTYGYGDSDNFYIGDRKQVNSLTDDEIIFFNHLLGEDSSSMQEYQVEFRPYEPFIIIDPESGTIVPYSVFDDEGSLMAKINIDRYKKYQVFSIGDDDKCKQALSDFEVGLAYAYGDYGLKPNHKLAMQWLKKAAENGDGEAMYEVSRLYKNGVGIPRSQRLADEWLQKAALANCTDAHIEVELTNQERTQN